MGRKVLSINQRTALTSREWSRPISSVRELAERRLVGLAVGRKGVDQVGQDLERHPRPDGQGRLPDELLHVRSNGGCPQQDPLFPVGDQHQQAGLVAPHEAARRMAEGKVATDTS